MYSSVKLEKAVGVVTTALLASAENKLHETTCVRKIALLIPCIGLLPETRTQPQQFMYKISTYYGNFQSLTNDDYRKPGLIIIIFFPMSCKWRLTFRGVMFGGALFSEVETCNHYVLINMGCNRVNINT